MRVRLYGVCAAQLRRRYVHIHRRVPHLPNRRLHIGLLRSGLPARLLPINSARLLTTLAGADRTPTIGGTEAYFTCGQGVFGSPCGDYDSNIPPRDVIFTYQPETWAGAADADVLAYSYINGNGDVFQFPTGAFQQPGTYNDDPFFPVGDSSGILTVSTTSTPEPASIPLAAVGVLILAIVIRRKAKVMPRISELG